MNLYQLKADLDKLIEQSYGSKEVLLLDPIAGDCINIAEIITDNKSDTVVLIGEE